MKASSKFLTIPPGDYEIFSQIVARLCFACNTEVDEDEAADIIEEYLGDSPDLDCYNVDDLARMIRTTIFDARFDTVH